MNILFVASECAPFVKTGGLADVIGAIPKAMVELGVSVKVMMPAYPAMKEVLKSGTVVKRIRNLHGKSARLVSVESQGIDLLLLDAPHLFNREGNIYLDKDGKDWPDNHVRFGGLSKVAADVATKGIKGWSPDLVHCHDWQAGLVPAYLHQTSQETPPCILTIHNVAFQGLFDAEVLDTLGLSQDLFTPDGMEYYGKLSFLKAGIAFSEKVTTVSPTYARELMLPEFGMGLEGMLQARRGDLVGILNGIDTEVWNPSTDPELVQNYSSRTMKQKSKNKTELEKRFGLKHQPKAPLFCVISRLTTQKGLDLLVENLPGIVGRGARLAVLGTGDRAIEGAFIGAAHQYKGSVGVIIGYDEELAHLMQGGSDAILVPSRFEPCGLTQLYGLRYGTLPVVARTGGLADTVIDANEAAIQTGCATGVQFSPVTTPALDAAIGRTCALYENKKIWTKMQRNAMRHSVGWDQSAQDYHDLYVQVKGTSER